MFRFIDKLKRGDIVLMRARRHTVSELHVLDNHTHTVVVEEVKNDKEYFVRCLNPAHDNTNWVNIHTDVAVSWDEEPTSIKESPVQRFKVILANFIRSDEEKAEFQVEDEEFVAARSFEKVVEAFPRGEYGYLMMINRETKERKIWEYDRQKWIVTAKEVIIHRRAAIKTVCFTGHRPKSKGVVKLPGGYDNLQHPGRVWIHEQIRAQLIDLAPEKVIVGGALGIDQEAFDIAWELMEEGVIKEVWIYVPCQGQESKWTSESAKTKYRAQITKAQTMGWVKMIHDGPYNSSCMQKRNVTMVNDSDATIAIWDGTEGGTANCVEYAKSKSKKIIRINPKDAPSGPTKVAKPDRFEEVHEEEVRKSATLSFKGHVRFNEGPAAGGYVLKDSNGKVLVEHGFSIGRDSIISADYRALIAGLTQAVEHGITDLTIRSHAGAVIKALESEGNTSHEFNQLYGEALDMLTHFRSAKWVQVTKEENILPETLAMRAHG